MECKLKKLLLKARKPKKIPPPATHIGKGYRLGSSSPEIEDIWLLDASRKAHLFVFATTRTGKTRLVENMIEQDIAKGYNVVMIDPKLDNELFSKVYQTALKTGRENELMLLSAIFPEYSVKINPLSHFYIAEEPISHIMAGVPAEDDFFYSVALETTTIIVRSLLMIKAYTNDETPLTFQEISSYAYYNGIVKLRDAIIGISGDDTAKLLTLMDQVLSSPVDYFAKVSNTLRTTLTQMTIGNIGKIIGNAKTNEFVDRLEKGEGVILYVQTGSMLTKKTADILAKVMISMIQSVAGRYFASGLAFEKPLCVYIDEMSNAVYPGIEDLFNKGGGANVYITGLTQSMADIVTELGKDRARKLFDNTNTKIFGRVNDVESAKIITDFGGVKNFHASMFNVDGGITAREVEEQLVRVEDVLRLKPREIYYFGFEGEYRGKTAPVHSSEIIIKLPRLISDEKL